MALVERFDLPAFLRDFDGILGQAEAWHRAVFEWFESSIQMEAPVVTKGGSGGTVQFYNPAKFDPGGPAVDQAITWNAFPKELLRKYGRDRALVEADRRAPLSRYKSTFNSEIHKRTPYRR